MLNINTPKGNFAYTIKPIYNGIKRINKEKAKENLLLFNKIAKKNNLKFVLCYGTLLGAIREHDFIDHDEDIDLFILDNQKDIFLCMLFELKDEGFELARYDRRGGLASLIRNNEYLDIYIFRPLSKELWESLGDPMPAKYILDLKEYDFQGENFWGARDSEEMMLFFYGKNWNIPTQSFNFNKSKLHRALEMLIWHIYFRMPDFLFNIIIKPREKKKFARYKRRKEVLEKNLKKSKSK